MAGAATGGYFVLRVATDARIKACIFIDSFFRLWDLALTRASLSFVKLWDSGWVPDGTFDSVIDVHCKSLDSTKSILSPPLLKIKRFTIHRT